MTAGMPIPRRLTRSMTPLLATLVVVMTLLGLVAHGATAAGATGDPSTNCVVPSSVVITDPLRAINICRAREGVPSMVLPRNWSRLTRSEQLLTVIDLERTSRGIAPVMGLTPTLNRLAAAGARQSTDPPFPAGGFERAGSIWSGTTSVLVADYGWMYSDGYGGRPLVRNLDCTGPGASGCWGHRNNILMVGRGVVGGAAYSGSRGGSYAFEVVTDYASTTDLKFSWKQEQKSLG